VSIVRRYFIFLMVVLLNGCAHTPEPKSQPPVASPTEPGASSTVEVVSPESPGQRYAGKDKDWGPNGEIDMSQVPDAVPRYELRTIAGNKNPYTVLGKTYTLLDDERSYKKRGIASWYGYKFNGERTSNGELYDMFSMTAAHKTLPIPSYVRVTNLNNQSSVIVRVNDRGPFHENRIIDLSYAAAQRLGITKNGTGDVEVEVLVPEDDPRPPLRKRKSEVVKVTKARSTTLTEVPQSSSLLRPGTYLQIAAFGNETSAQKYSKNIASQLPFPVVISSTSDQPILYRVRVGPLSDARSLQDTRAQLEKINIAQSYVVYE
jgi:rare lipoprotein A